MENETADPVTLARLAQIQYSLNVLASVPDHTNPDIQTYVSQVLQGDPSKIAAMFDK